MHSTPFATAGVQKLDAGLGQSAAVTQLTEGFVEHQFFTKALPSVGVPRPCIQATPA
jgi:hypothetical protein